MQVEIKVKITHWFTELCIGIRTCIIRKYLGVCRQPLDIDVRTMTEKDRDSGLD